MTATEHAPTDHASTPSPAPGGGRSPEPPRRWRALLLAAVAACAACGIVYELALLTLSTSLNGGGIVATSLIVAGYIAALGAGALAIKPLLAHAAITFIAVEVALGIIGGVSAAALYVAFAFLDAADGSAWVLAVSTALIGGLVGAEVPLLMTLLQRGRVAGATDSGRTLANLNAADYLGALVGGLAWPFVLLPHLGMIRGAAATGMVNLVAAAIVAIFLLRPVVSPHQLLTALCVLLAAFGLLVTLLVRSRDIETTSRQQLYDDPIIAYRHTAYQEIVVTRRGDDLRLYLDGGLQFSTRDEYRYTESLVYPALRDDARSALILGGGDGLAARELLRTPRIDTIVQVELDSAVIELARTTMRTANSGSLDNPRVHVVIDDAMGWLRHAQIPSGGFDAVIVDLPDPDTLVLGRLYSTEFYALAARALAADGLMVVQAGSPFSTPMAFWRTVSTIADAGFSVTPYHVHVPTFGDWGFVLARRGKAAPMPVMPADAPPLRFLNPQVLEAATVFAGDIGPRALEPSTLEHPRIVEDMRTGYR
ncbi:polyamine aminopropyltransferase [Mycobacterium spongiae]|uniref:Polyamine aminopropyltransferase n=1 Tax=Mycobacterium spongiae TaxID=886343 RepID=A0A975JWV1_9MYCO|nr:polyamine aminopropyltransferase [Mycobacterium spongiae]QUR67156.1 polyamine aminopropyltransferase [Mycobacterium spongiae]